MRQGKLLSEEVSLGWQASFLVVANSTFHRLAQAGRHEVRAHLCGFLYSPLVCLGQCFESSGDRQNESSRKTVCKAKSSLWFFLFSFEFPLPHHWYCLGNYLGFKLLGFLVFSNYFFLTPPSPIHCFTFDKFIKTLETAPAQPDAVCECSPKHSFIFLHCPHDSHFVSLERTSFIQYTIVVCVSEVTALCCVVELKCFVHSQDSVWVSEYKHTPQIVPQLDPAQSYPRASVSTEAAAIASIRVAQGFSCGTLSVGWHKGAQPTVCCVIPGQEVLGRLRKLAVKKPEWASQ